LLIEIKAFDTGIARINRIEAANVVRRVQTHLFIADGFSKSIPSGRHHIPLRYIPLRSLRCNRAWSKDQEGTQTWQKCMKKKSFQNGGELPTLIKPARKVLRCNVNIFGPAHSQELPSHFGASNGNG
jgi:hypothetical protein